MNHLFLITVFYSDFATSSVLKFNIVHVPLSLPYASWNAHDMASSSCLSSVCLAVAAVWASSRKPSPCSAPVTGFLPQPLASRRCLGWSHLHPPWPWQWLWRDMTARPVARVSIRRNSWWVKIWRVEALGASSTVGLLLSYRKERNLFYVTPLTFISRQTDKDTKRQTLPQDARVHQLGTSG